MEGLIAGLGIVGVIAVLILAVLTILLPVSAYLAQRNASEMETDEFFDDEDVLRQIHRRERLQSASGARGGVVTIQGYESKQDSSDPWSLELEERMFTVEKDEPALR